MKREHVVLTLTALALLADGGYWLGRGETGLAVLACLFHGGLTGAFLRTASERTAWPKHGRGQVSVCLRMILLILAPLLVCTVLARIGYALFDWPKPYVLLVAGGGWFLLSEALSRFLFPGRPWTPSGPPRLPRGFSPRDFQ